MSRIKINKRIKYTIEPSREKSERNQHGEVALNSTCGPGHFDTPGLPFLAEPLRFLCCQVIKNRKVSRAKKSVVH